MTMRVIIITGALTLFALASSSCTQPTDCKCSYPFDGMTYGTDYRSSILTFESASADDGQMAIHFYTFDKPGDPDSGVTSWVRLFKNDEWSTQKLISTGSLWWPSGPFFAYQGGRWHAATTVDNAATGGKGKTVYLRQNDDGSFGAATVVQNLIASDRLAHDGFAMGSDGRVAIAMDTDDGTLSKAVPILFAEKPAGTEVFSSEWVAVGGTQPVGTVYFAGYDHADEPLIVYGPPNAATKQWWLASELRLLRKSGGAWSDRSILSVPGSMIGENSFSATVGPDDLLILSFGITPVSTQGVSLIGAAYSITDGALKRQSSILDIGPDQPMDIYDLYTRTRLTGSGDNATVFSSWVGLKSWKAPVYFSSFDPTNGFAQPTEFLPGVQTIFASGGIAQAGDMGPAFVSLIPECDGQGNFNGKNAVRVLPLSANHN